MANHGHSPEQQAAEQHLATANPEVMSTQHRNSQDIEVDTTSPPHSRDAGAKAADTNRNAQATSPEKNHESEKEQDRKGEDGGGEVEAAEGEVARNVDDEVDCWRRPVAGRSAGVVSDDGECLQSGRRWLWCVDRKRGKSDLF